MTMFRCFSLFSRRNKKNKKDALSSKKDNQTLLVKIQHGRASSESRYLETTTFNVAVPSGMRQNSMCNVRVMSLESPVKAEVDDAYEGEDEHSLSIQRENSDLCLHGLETSAVGKGEYDPTNILEDKNDEFSERSFDISQSRHASEPGIGKAKFCASPKLKRSCSNLERTVVFRETTLHLARSKSQSFHKDLMEVSVNSIVDIDSLRSPMSNCSADRVMLKRHSSSQVLPSGSKKIWWKLFLWSHRNIHKTSLSKSTKSLPACASLYSQCGYHSDTLEPKKGKALRHVDSSESVATEFSNKNGMGENIDHQMWTRFHNEKNSGIWPQNQWVAFSTESSSFSRVDAWIKDLESSEILLEDDCDDDNDKSIVFPPSPDAAGRSLIRSTSQTTQYPNSKLSKEILIANNVVKSLNPASNVAHISGIGIKAIPTISHLNNLRSVNLSNNSIDHISPGFLPKSIHVLNLSRNKISNLDGLRELTKLWVLDLSYNRISRIGQGLSNCTLIKELYLAGNKVSDVEGLHRLLKLTVLDLSFNKITTTKALGQLVANYNSLVALNLIGNPIQRNIGNDQLHRAATGLIPKLVYLNRQPVNHQRAREASSSALGKGIRCKRRSPKKDGQGVESSSIRGHRSNVSVVHNGFSRTRGRYQKR